MSDNNRTTNVFGEEDESDSSFSNSSALSTSNIHLLPDFKGKSFDELGGETPVCFLTGQAGTGKTFTLLQKIQQDPKYAFLCATTGIAAINLNAVTVNSVLKFGTVEGLFDAYTNGYLQKALRGIKKSKFQWLVIDEISMAHKLMLDYIMLALDEVNADNSDEPPLGLMITGDFAQLPPVPGTMYDKDGRPVVKNSKEIREPTPWAFESKEWNRFEVEGKTIKLTKVWRQSEGKFLEAINAIRRGNGMVGAMLLQQSGVTFASRLNQQFDGTTIVAKNDEVDRFNQAALMQIEGEGFQIGSKRWHARRYEPSEWKNIPEKLNLKVGAYVMLLVNEPQSWTYVNGDCGHIRQVKRKQNDDGSENPTGEVEAIGIELVRKPIDQARIERCKADSDAAEAAGEFFIPAPYDGLIWIRKITREVSQRGEPTDDERENPKVMQKQIGRRLLWVLGELEYFPIRLAYATTCHKSQGLSLDKVQISISSWFFGSPQMAYVSISRCRTAEGLTIVGTPAELAKKVKIDNKITRFL